MRLELANVTRLAPDSGGSIMLLAIDVIQIDNPRGHYLPAGNGYALREHPVLREIVLAILAIDEFKSIIHREANFRPIPIAVNPANHAAGVTPQRNSRDVSNSIRFRQALQRVGGSVNVESVWEIGMTDLRLHQRDTAPRSCFSGGVGDSRACFAGQILDRHDDRKKIGLVLFGNRDRFIEPQMLRPHVIVLHGQPFVVVLRAIIERPPKMRVAVPGENATANQIDAKSVGFCGIGADAIAVRHVLPFVCADRMPRAGQEDVCHALSIAA